MKQINRYCLVLTLLLLAVPVTWAATPSKSSPKAASSATPAAKAKTPSTIARDPYLGAIAIDATTGKVLFEDQADAKGYPASMQKLLDLLIILEKVKRGQFSFQDQVLVSRKAAQTGGSQVYLAEKESFSLDDMLYALMVQSANDAAVALAEKVAGSTEAFVDLMNQRAKELGMNNSAFHSVHGLPPGKGQEHDVTTARDFTLLCRELLKHPDALRYTSTRERPFRTNIPSKTIIMRNHDHLLTEIDGCDGFKTGYFAAAGYSIAVTAIRQGQRVIVVVMDSPTIKSRDGKAKELVAKGFATLLGTPAASTATKSSASKSSKSGKAPATNK
jgi:serine-type D-Ala-D-Ala carboxypeptidase (penicillin-binding protein 5/6)